MLIYPPTSTLEIGWARMRRSRVGKTVKVITRGQGKCATAPFKWRNEVAKNTNSCYNIKLRKRISYRYRKNLHKTRCDKFDFFGMETINSSLFNLEMTNFLQR